MAATAVTKLCSTPALAGPTHSGSTGAFQGSRAVASRSSNSISRSSSIFGTRLACAQLEASSQRRRTGTLKVKMALSRVTKEAAVEKVKQTLEGCTLAAAFSFEKLSVKQMEKLRRAMPENATVMVVKNKLVGKAIEGNPKFEALKAVLKKQNCWLFYHGEEFGAAIKPYREMQKELKLDTDFVGGVLDGMYIAPGDFERVEKLPTKKEIMARIARAIKMVPTKLATSIKMVPTKVAIAVDKVREKKAEEEKGSTE